MRPVLWSRSVSHFTKPDVPLAFRSCSPASSMRSTVTTGGPLAKLIDTAPDIAATLEGEGIAPVACYTLTPRLDDLAALETLETAGFRPKATLLLFNEGRVDSSMSRDEAFARVARHTAVRNALTRGAVPIWMPRLEPEVMGEIEGKRLQFTQARDGQVPQGARFAPVGGLERAMVRRWLERMEQEHAAIPSWLL